ncbi:hypothetical protein QR680_018486 [Steinernema hermaphroditum]|uniref:Uncharacterized protein n=1 Tax=Steinernema hermaphroditum TaxID=289476 RepID=A0AA39HI40_9BILA|nr:hypothetical protein QR680_018486 [Steinernema hermaphroditum]
MNRRKPNSPTSSACLCDVQSCEKLFSRPSRTMPKQEFEFIDMMGPLVAAAIFIRTTTGRSMKSSDPVGTSN